MSLNDNAVLRIAMGSKPGGGYVTPDGHYVVARRTGVRPVSFGQSQPDEWSQDIGCGVSTSLSGRRAPCPGGRHGAGECHSEQLKEVQRLMAQDDPRAAAIYRTIGVYLGYGAAHFARFYALRHILILGRVTTGRGCDLILEQARRVLATEFPDLAATLTFHVPDETNKRHGQAIAAASLPSTD